MKKFSKILFGALAIMLITGCDFKQKDDIVDECENNNVEEKEEVVEEKVEVDVITAIEYTDSYYNKLDVRIPMIKSFKEGALNLNKKMAEDVLKYHYVFSDAIEDGYWGKNGATIDYDYIIKNNIIAIYIEGKVKDNYEFPGSGDGVNRYNYFYDIDNDKEISMVEALPLMGHTTNDLKEFDITTFEQLQSDGFSYYIIENGKGRIHFIDCREGCV